MSLPTALRRLAPCVVLLAVLLGGCLRSAALRSRSGRPAGNEDTASTRSLAITDVTVIDVVAGVARRGQTVVVRGEQIIAVGPVADIGVPPSAAVIEGSGKFLIPGLWDMHAHIADPAMPAMFLRYGITGVRHMFSFMPGMTDVRQSRSSREVHPNGPHVVAAAQILDGSGTPFGFPFNLNVIKADTPEAARAGVRKLRAKGNDFVKVLSALPRAAYFAAVDEAGIVGLPVVGHVPYTVTAAEASDAGQLTIEHLDGVAVSCSALEERGRARLRDFASASRPDPHTPWRVECEALETLDATKTDALFTKFAANRTWHVPTLVEARSKALLGRPDALDPEVEKHLPALARRFWKREFKGGSVSLVWLGRTYTRRDLLDRQALLRGELELVGRMHRAGVRILAGTDTPNPLIVPGRSLHEELELFVAAGLTPAAALRAATADPAECLGISDSRGTVEVGKRADLLLLARDPLADIRNTLSIEVVLLGGQPVPPHGNDK